MTANSQGVYSENKRMPMRQESRRLETFGIPSRVSLSHTRRIGEGAIFLDFGAGENPDLRHAVQTQQGNYIPIDRRSEAIAKHLQGGANGITADLLNLPAPLGRQFADYAHTRFVLGHFPDRDERAQVVRNTLGMVRPGGKGLYIDYDWTAMDGSEAVKDLRDFTLANIVLFDAAYGSKSSEDIREIVAENASMRTSRHRPEPQTNYYPLTSIREVTQRALQAQQSNPELQSQAGELFDQLDAEAASPNAPGFRMPDIVTVRVTPNRNFIP